MTDYLKLVLIRHAESLGNRAGRMEGQMSTGLSGQGKRQAQQLRAYLGTQPSPSHIYSSPLKRAMETAHGLETLGDCQLQLDPALQELHQGIFQGLTWQQACQQYPDLCHQLTTSLDYCPVPQAETLDQAHRRAMAWYRQLWQMHHPGDLLWIISHSGFMLQLLRVILGCDRTWQIPIGHTAIFEVWLLQPFPSKSASHTNPELWKIMKFNQTMHLETQLNSAS